MDNKKFWKKENNDWIINTTNILTKSISTLYDINKEELFPYKEFDYIKINDLINLPILNEPYILEAIHKRYNNDDIYTNCGNILLSVNPFKYTNLYSDENKSKYVSLYDSLDNKKAHIYNIVNIAYKFFKINNTNQSILISGESGAGKTQSTKIIIEYLIFLVDSLNNKNIINRKYLNSIKLSSTTSNISSNVSIISYSSTNDSDDFINIEPVNSSYTDITKIYNNDLLNNIVYSNPILESFGNAKTINNNNSSRFGKFIKIMFNSLDQIIGCNIETFLLEKVRVLSQYKEERNFHIFYEVIEGLNNNEKEQYFIKDISEYQCVQNNNSNSMQIKSDIKNFNKIINLLNNINISSDILSKIYCILSFILNLRECTFKFNIKILDILTDLINKHSDNQINSTYIYDNLYQRQLNTGNETIKLDLNEDDFYNRIKSLCMKLYNSLFDFIITAVNDKLNIVSTRFIGILDIFGFESLESNSFEQLCINYVNESLQNQFNKYTLQQTQEEYIKENINWDYVDYCDNKKCLDLIVGKPGVLDILDEQCKVNGNYSSFLNRINNNTIFIDSPYYTYDNLKKNAFYIKHYAGKIKYNATEFCHKNKDIISNEAHNIVSQFDLFNNNNEIKQNNSIGSKSVSFQFKKQMKELMNIIDKTNVHYIRCFKPNNISKSNVFNRSKILEQLNNNGILETIKVSRSSFAVKYSYLEFNNIYLFNKYNNDSFLKDNIKTDDIFKMFKSNKKDDPATKIKNVLLKTNNAINDYQFGLTKIFLKSDSFNKLEKYKTRITIKYIIYIQSIYKKIFYTKKYNKILSDIKLIQANIRRYSIQVKYKKYLESVIKTQSSILIQKNIRRFIDQIKYKKYIKSIITIQLFLRSILAKYSIKYLKSIIKIQSFFRKLRCIYVISAIKLYKVQIQNKEDEYIKPIIKIQSLVRRKIQLEKYNNIKNLWSNKNQYKILDYSELLTKYISEIEDSLDKSTIIDELSEINKELMSENELLKKNNEVLRNNYKTILYDFNKLSTDNRSYLECVKLNIEKRIELLYKMDDYKLKNEILENKLTDIYKRL